MNSEKLQGYLRHAARFARAFIKWLILGIAMGLLVGCVGAAFAHVLLGANALRAAQPLVKLGLPLGGIAIVFIYRLRRDHADSGTNTVVASVRSGRNIPIEMAPRIFLSTAITQLFGGSAGREGAALQLGGSIANFLGKCLHLDEKDQKTVIMCGMSAGFSALFGTPMAAAVFSMEVVRVGVMQYAGFVPCVLSSLTAHLVARFFRVPPEVFPVEVVPELTAISFAQILLFAVAAALVSILFCVALHESEHLYEKHIKNPYLRIVLGGTVVVALSFAAGEQYLGSGMGIIEELLHHGHSVPWFAFLLKILFTSLTLGSGFKGGEIVPSLTIGACLGSFLGALLGLPVELVTACGMAGVFCGVTNSPMTALLLAFELFGFAGMPYYLITVSVSYLLSGYHSLYREQRFATSKTETDGRGGIPVE